MLQVDASSGRFLKINQKFADMLGYRSDELLQLTLKDITHPDDHKKNLDQINLLKKKQVKEFSIEKRYIRKDGTILWAILTVTVLNETTDGKLTNIGIAQDITERKKAEQELKESEEKFKTVFNQSPIGLELYNMDGQLLDCNPACLNMFGIDNILEVIGFNLFEDPNLTEQQKCDIKIGKNVLFEIKFDFDIVKKLNLYNTSKSGHCFLSCFATSFKTE